MKGEQVVILIIDDSREDRQTLRSLIHEDTEARHIFLEADKGRKGLELLRTRDVDCTLLDYHLPDLDGMEVLHEISGDDELSQVPVIFLTGHGDEMVAAQAMKNGATDYIDKNLLSGELLTRAVRHTIEKKRAEKALKETEARLQAILDYSPALISTKDLMGNVTMVNKHFEILDGPSSEEFIGRNIYDLFPKDVAEVLWKNDLSAFNKGGPIEAEEDLKHRDGTLHTYLSVKFPIYGKGGRPFGVCAISTDITDRKRAEKKIRENERILRSMINAITESAALTDTRGTVLTINETAAQRLSTSVKDARGKNLYDFFSPEITKSRKARAEETIRKATPIQFEDERLGRIYNNSIYPILDSDGRVTQLAFFGYDITEMKRAEEALRESGRLEAVIETAGAVCHELNQPLQVLSGLSQLMMMDTKKGMSLNEMAHKIKIQTDRIAEITEKLTGVTRYETKDYFKNKIIDIDRASESERRGIST